MTIAFRQLITASVTSAVPTTVFLPSDPLNGSALIAVVACAGTAGPSLITQTGAAWNLLYEADGPVTADEQALAAVRVQIWGAFNVQAAGGQIELEFTGATTDRGIIVAEYTGNMFRFPNPADRVSKDSDTTPPETVGSVEVLGTSDTREAEELFAGAAAADQNVTFQNPDSPFSIRSQADIGSPANGRVALLDAFAATTQTPGMIVEHTAKSGPVNWAGVVAALRGALQAPNPGVNEPVVGEPVTENTDHEGDAIGHLLEQFKSHD